jgi:acyl-CoA synthetase (AMP-forming)/AMP-acid ligase II
MTDPPSGVHHRARPLKAIPIDDLAEAAGAVGGVKRRELDPGDRVIVSTRNSVYSLTARADGTFDVSGGWFEREGSGRTTVEILGCTAGGHALFTDHIAAPGLFMEFCDGLRTTRIRTVRRITDDK